MVEPSQVGRVAVRAMLIGGDFMDKKIAGLLGAVATLGAMNAAQAAPTPAPVPTDVMRANSFADLLDPIPNAAASSMPAGMTPELAQRAAEALAREMRQKRGSSLQSSSPPRRPPRTKKPLRLVQS